MKCVTRLAKKKSPLWNFSRMIYHGFLNLSIFDKKKSRFVVWPKQCCIDTAFLKSLPFTSVTDQPKPMGWKMKFANQRTASSAMQYSCFQMLGKWWLPLEITICWSCNSFFQNDSHSREKQQYWKMSTGRDFSPTFPHAPILAKTGDSAPMSSSASFSRCRFIF